MEEINSETSQELIILGEVATEEQANRMVKLSTLATERVLLSRSDLREVGAKQWS